MLIVRRLEQGRSMAQVASTFGSIPRTVRKWRDRFTDEAWASGLAA
jgi:transposase-like protein